MQQRRILQIVVVICSFVPILGGGSGILFGPAIVNPDHASVFADSHYRYLSGLLLGIGIAFLATVPRIEDYRARFRLLAAIVVIGGLGRLLSVILHGAADWPSLFALVMELAVTPAIAVWQGRVAAASSRTG